MKGKSKSMGVKRVEAKGGDGFHAMKKNEHSGKAHLAHGGKVKHRADKKARGGKTMSPSSPLSGAEPKGLSPKVGEMD